MENTIFFILSQIQTALLGQISLDFIAKSVFLIYAFFSLNWPKKGQKSPFGALDGKIRMYGCEATKIAVVLAPTYLR